MLLYCVVFNRVSRKRLLMRISRKVVGLSKVSPKPIPTRAAQIDWEHAGMYWQWVLAGRPVSQVLLHNVFRYLGYAALFLWHGDELKAVHDLATENFGTLICAFSEQIERLSILCNFFLNIDIFSDKY